MSSPSPPRRGHRGMPPPPRPGEFEQLAEQVLASVVQRATPGDAQSVLDAMDAFAYEHWMMNVGDVKGPIVDEEIAQVRPRVMAELGGFVGYSAVRFASQLRAVSGPSARYFSFEFSPEFAAVATQIVAFAGLSDVVTIVVGAFSDTYTTLRELGVDHVDIFFIDHDKRLYLSDLKLIEKSGLLRPGAVVIADNVLSPGVPDYLEYVRASPSFTSVLHESFVEYQAEMKDGVEVSTYVHATR